jgi:nucleoside-diphosphate kinase
MAIERTFSIIKPDATERNITGKIIDKLESGVAADLSSLRAVAYGGGKMPLEVIQKALALKKEKLVGATPFGALGLDLPNIF